MPAHTSGWALDGRSDEVVMIKSGRGLAESRSRKPYLRSCTRHVRYSRGVEGIDKTPDSCSSPLIRGKLDRQKALRS